MLDANAFTVVASELVDRARDWWTSYFICIISAIVASVTSPLGIDTDAVVTSEPRAGNSNGCWNQGSSDVCAAEYNVS